MAGDVYAAYDWTITFVVDGYPREGATGRALEWVRARERVVAALRELPPEANARGVIERVCISDPDLRIAIAMAERAGNGEINWSH